MHSMTQDIRVRARLLVVAVAFVLFAASCGDDGADLSSGPATPEDGQASESTPDDQPHDDAPGDGTTVTHKYGTTAVPPDPQRVVSVGFSDQDDLLALGVVPIGIRDWYGDQPSAVWPWARSALGSAEPAVIAADELNIESIAALDPDLIIGVSSGMTEAEYGLLSAIAPTVAQSGDYPDYGMPWQERTRLIGATFGMVDDAEALISGIEQRFEQARVDHPEFAGATAAVAFVFDGQPGAYASADVRARVMGDLGFETPAAFDEIAGDSFFASFSPERIDLLDTDVVVWLAGEAEAKQAILDSPLRDGLSSATEGREVFVGEELGGAFSFASPLSLGYLLDELVPELALAVDGDPSTVVPSAVAAGAALPDDASADGGAGGGAGGGERAEAASVWERTFDSDVPFSEKEDLIAGTEEQLAVLAAVHEEYLATAATFGGISVDASAEIDGSTATIDYSILFAGSPSYSDLTGVVTRSGGDWKVAAEDFCGFMASARVDCTV